MHDDQASKNGRGVDDDGDEERRHPRVRGVRSKVRYETRLEEEISPEVEELDREETRRPA